MIDQVADEGHACQEGGDWMGVKLRVGNRLRKRATGPRSFCYFPVVCSLKEKRGATFLLKELPRCEFVVLFGNSSVRSWTVLRVDVLIQMVRV